MNLFLDHVFGYLNLHRVALGVVASNERAIRLYELVGETSSVVAVVLEPRLIKRAISLAQTNGISILDVKFAKIYHLPFEDNSFGATCMITVFGEIPKPERALGEFFGVLKSSGAIAFNAILTDTDYPSRHSLTRKVLRAKL